MKLPLCDHWTQGISASESRPLPVWEAPKVHMPMSWLWLPECPISWAPSGTSKLLRYFPLPGGLFPGWKVMLPCLDVLTCFTTVVAILYFGTYARCWPRDAGFLRVSGWQGAQGCSRLPCSGCGVSLLQWGHRCAYCPAWPAKFLCALPLARMSPCYVSRLRVLNKDILTCTQIPSLPSCFSNYQVWFYPWTHPGGWNLSSPIPPKYPVA